MLLLLLRVDVGSRAYGFSTRIALHPRFRLKDSGFWAKGSGLGPSFELRA